MTWRHMSAPLALACALAGCSTPARHNNSDQDASSSSGKDAAAPRPTDAGSRLPTDGSGPPTDAGSANLRNVCSGCATDTLDRTDHHVRFHHVHLNVTDPEASRAFYTRFFDAEPVRFNDKMDALWVAPMFFLFHEVATAPDDTLEMGLDHVGRGSKDPAAWFVEVSKQGVMGDPRQGFSATPMQIGSGVPPDGFSYIYVRGPQAERFEAYSAGLVVIPGHTDAAETFQHVHLLTADVDVTAEWYSDFLELPANPNNGLGRDLVLDRVSLFFGSNAMVTSFVPTDDRPLGHMAFSVSDLAVMRDRAERLGLEIVAEPKLSDDGFRSFFVRAPDHVLLELVEAGPIEPD